MQEQNIVWENEYKKFQNVKYNKTPGKGARGGARGFLPTVENVGEKGKNTTADAGASQPQTLTCTPYSADWSEG